MTIHFHCLNCRAELQADDRAAGASGSCPKCGWSSTVPGGMVPELPPDFDAATAELVRRVLPYTMTSPERIAALREAVAYVTAHRVPGDIVECGVWKGGSMMAVAWTLLELGARRRRLHLFDTFEGMTAPGPADRDLRGGLASDILAVEDKQNSLVWAYSPLDEVRRNLQSTGYDANQIDYVAGRVEDTIPAQAPQQIALLRLDTDWYGSTLHELVHLYPRLSVGGVLIIDDYGHWQGARKAVDEYLHDHRLKILLHRIDYTGRIGVKQA